MAIIRIKAYNRHSRGVNELRMALADFGHRVYKYDRESNRVSTHDISRNFVLNWGSSRPFPIVSALNGANLPHDVINSHANVGAATNKLSAFEIMARAGIVVVPNTTNEAVAASWVRAGHTVVERHILNGHTGAGIRLVDNVDDLRPAPLYTAYKKKKDEYRVHVFNGRVIDVQQKRIKRQGIVAENIDYKIRNHDTGWVYCREALSVTPDNLPILEGLAIGAITALGLDFGAVDIIYNERENTFYVLEVNTAVGLEGTTASKYAAAIHNMITGG
jgi:hypothetical protein